MVRVSIENGARLNGVVMPPSDDKLVMAASAAALLSARGMVILDRVTSNLVVKATIDFMTSLGGQASLAGNTFKVNATHPLNPIRFLPSDQILFLGPLLLRCGRVSLVTSLPDDWLAALHQIGISSQLGRGKIVLEVQGRGLHGGTVDLPKNDEIATMIMMLTATVIPGITVLKSAAISPAVTNLALLLNRMGAHIHGAGTSLLRLQGVTFLHGGMVEISRAQEAAAELAMLAALTAGDLLIKGADAHYLGGLLADLEIAGNTVIKQTSGIRIIGTSILLPTQINLRPMRKASLITGICALSLLIFAHGYRQLIGANLDLLSSTLAVLDQLGIVPTVQNDVVTLKGQLETPVAGPITALTAATALTWILIALRGPAPLDIDLPDQVAYQVQSFMEMLTKQGIPLKISAPS